MTPSANHNVKCPLSEKRKRDVICGMAPSQLDKVAFPHGQRLGGRPLVLARFKFHKGAKWRSTAGPPLCPIQPSDEGHRFAMRTPSHMFFSFAAFCFFASVGSPSGRAGCFSGSPIGCAAVKTGQPRTVTHLAGSQVYSVWGETPRAAFVRLPTPRRRCSDKRC